MAPVKFWLCATRFQHRVLFATALCQQLRASVMSQLRVGSWTPSFKKISPTVGLTVWAVSRLCTVLGITIDVLNQDGLRGKKIKRGILLAAVHILTIAKRQFVCKRLTFVCCFSHKSDTCVLCRVYQNHHIMKTEFEQWLGSSQPATKKELYLLFWVVPVTNNKVLQYKIRKH